MQSLLDFQKRSGFTPTALLNRPRLIPELRFYRDAYSRLSRGRQWGDSGPQPILVSEATDYAERLGVRGAESMEVFLDMVQAQDDVFLEVLAEQRKAASEAKSDVVGV